ncbi:hypothetical protein FHS29_003382 [Saccharothrix tamanrassetensis]|uniref:DUF4231 domain-containing protein n=1 Tax=Saccharothrix tamanrassetensis TaxID=1051531 RepID=A0A841CHK9_9PSEU|nr:DUF4231 domain-containing protein [Saccharothrix tamanrassetensis]MBB5956789.1 hypothetical protein [Saccharothrix tamanrassetensis]
MSGLPDGDLPGLFEAADAASLDGQRRYVRTVRLRLVLAVLAAVFGVFSWTVGRIDLAAIGTAIALAAVTVTEVNLKSTRPEDRWYDGRALAESAKSLAWKFSVGGAPFGKAGPEDAAERGFIEQLGSLLEEAPTTAITPSKRPVVTDAMRALRAADLATRKEVYLRERIVDQQDWYAGKARRNERQAGWWRTSLLTIEVAGICAALARAVGAVRIDLAGVVAAVIAAGTAWMSLRQLSTLARAYTFAANELGIVRGRLELVDEEEAWSAEVADAEDAVSREHTMWRASRTRPSG